MNGDYFTLEDALILDRLQNNHVLEITTKLDRVRVLEESDELELFSSTDDAAWIRFSGNLIMNGIQVQEGTEQ